MLMHNWPTIGSTQPGEWPTTIHLATCHCHDNTPHYWIINTDLHSTLLYHYASAAGTVICTATGPWKPKNKYMVTFPAIGHHCPVTGIKLHCLVTEAYVREQLAWPLSRKSIAPTITAPSQWTSGRRNYYDYYSHFMALWTLSGTTRVSQYQKVHFAIFWIFWCKMKITQADAPTRRSGRRERKRTR